MDLYLVVFFRERYGPAEECNGRTRGQPVISVTENRAGVRVVGFGACVLARLHVFPVNVIMFTTVNFYGLT